jgi:hypothetical protein
MLDDPHDGESDVSAITRVSTAYMYAHVKGLGKILQSRFHNVDSDG